MVRKNLLLALLIFTGLALSGCCAKVAVIDTEQAFRQSNAGKSGIAYLEALTQDIHGDLSALQEKAHKTGKKSDYVQLQTQVQEAQHFFAVQQQDIIERIAVLYRNALANYHAKNCRTVLIAKEDAVIYNAKDDITAKIIKEMNKTPVAFRSAPTGKHP